MGRRPTSGSSSSFDVAADGLADPAPDMELEWPYGRIDSIDRNDLRETAYELFFTSCRSSPGFGGRNPITYYPSSGAGAGSAGGGGGGDSSGGGLSSSSSGEASPGRGKGSGGGGGGGGTGMTVVTSKIKKALGLRTRRPSLLRAMSQSASTGPGSSPGKVKQRPMTSAEIMRQQMGVTEQSDGRLRKTLLRGLVGQAGRRAETIILPLELLRQLKPSEFSNANEHHQWQRRQLKILEAGLLSYPSIPLDYLNAAAQSLRDVIRSSETKPINTGKNSEPMRALCNSVMSLAWRSPTGGTTTEVCHWADGYPLNVHLYLALLHSIFDHRDETVVLDEVDELMELIKKTWTTLGINRMTHNVCFTWILFEQYVMTGQVELDLLSATLAMIGEVASDAKRRDREAGYQRVLSLTMASMQAWAVKKMVDYQEGFEKGAMGVMENVLRLALSTAKILSEDVLSCAGGGGAPPAVEERCENMALLDWTGNRVDQYIRSSMKHAFDRIYENGNGKVDSMIVEVDEDPAEVLIHLGRETESLAMSEKESFSPILKKYHPVPTAVAVVVLHNCYGVVLKQFLGRIASLANESVRVLQTAAKLEKTLVQMVVEDAADCDDGGKAIVREMVPYEVDTIIHNLMKSWIDERLRIGRDCLNRAKETESWNPKSKSEPYAQSAVDLMRLVKVMADEFFEIPVAARDELVQDLADGLETLFQDYTTFVSTCGTKQGYIPTLPPLTRCSQESRLVKLLKTTTTCQSGIDHHNSPKKGVPADSHHPRPATSRGTQRLYVRLNTLHYLLAVLHSIDKSLSFFARSSPRGTAAAPSPSPSPRSRRRVAPTHFDLTRASLHAAILHVSEVAAYRLIFLDSSHSFYEGLYLGGVENARIHPTLRTLKQNLTLLVAVLTDRAQTVAVREVMKASFEAFLMVLLAGGSGRSFARTDSEAVEEDFECLKRVFCTAGEGLVSEEVVEREAEVVEGILALMAQSTEKLVEDFSVAACESSGLGALGGAGPGQKLPMPPTTGRWNRADPNTLLRVLCHRNDDASNRFLKRTFQLAKRR